MATAEPKERRRRCKNCRELFTKEELVSHSETCGQQQLVPLEEDNLFFLPAVATQYTPPVPEYEDRHHDLPENKVEGWPLRYGRISASAIGAFLGCPENFRRKYIVGDKGVHNGAALAGSAAHHVVETAIRFQLKEGEPMPVDYWDQVFDGGFEHQRDKAYRDNGVEWGDQSENDWVVRGKTAAHAYLYHVLPNLNPIGCEEMFVAHVADVPVPLVGFLDIVEPTRVRDMKFGKNKNRVQMPGWRIQKYLYIFATEKEMVWDSVNWKGEFYTHQDSVGLRAMATPENYTIGANLVRNTVQAILAYSKTYGEDSTWPGAITHPWLCGGCYFRDQGCEWWEPKVHSLL